MHQCRDARPIVVFIVLTIVATTLGGQATTENFRTIKIDPKTLVLKLEEPLPLVPSPNHDFYQLFRGNTISVVHLGPRDSRVSYNAFEIDNQGSLLRRTKFQVLSEGPYGTVFAESTYFYGEQYNHQPTDFHVDLYFTDGSHEPAQEVRNFRAPGTLSAISMVRVFKAAPGYLVACATYDATGRLSVNSINGSKGGGWVHSNEVHALYPDLDVGTIYEDRPKVRRYFGLPERFPVSDYLETPHNVALPTTLRSFSDVVNMHYQRNRFVRQDVFSTGGLPKSHFLKYTMTPEDQQLDAIDSTIKFGR